MKMPRILIAAIAFAAPAAAGTSLVAATWNIAWFGDGVGDRALTGNDDGRHLRGEEEFGRLRAVVAQLAALEVEVVSLQEIENEAAARLLFPAEDWDLHFSTRDTVPAWAQSTAIVVRRDSGWSAERHPDVVEWSPQGRDRHGVDLTLTRGEERVRVLGVHFQSGCNDRPLSSGGNRCGFLRMQIAILTGWLHERMAEGVPLVVAGDWNRRISRPEDEVAAGLPFDPVIVPPPGSKPSCWDSRFPWHIDHLVAFAPPGGRAEAGPVVEVLFGAPPEFADTLSDHCPIVGTFRFRP